jgi:hypothetical protein
MAAASNEMAANNCGRSMNGTFERSGAHVLHCLAGLPTGFHGLISRHSGQKPPLAGL